MGDWCELLKVDGFFLAFRKIVGNVGLRWFDGEGEVPVLI